MSKFKPGDIVEAFGLRGVVRSIKNGSIYPVEVDLDIEDYSEYEVFTVDGLLHEWHKTPSLTLIERPKKTKVVTMYQAILLGASGRYYLSEELFENEAQAKKAFPDSFIKLNHVPITVEVEVEDEEA